jgi:hypothetical protein
MKKVRLFFKPLVTAVVFLALPAAPFFNVVSLSAKTGTDACGMSCCCCEQKTEVTNDGNLGVTAKCACDDMGNSRPVKDIPPLAAPVLSRDKNIESPVVFNDSNLPSINFNTRSFVLSTDIVDDDVGPPLYIVHSSLLI